MSHTREEILNRQRDQLLSGVARLTVDDEGHAIHRNMPPKNLPGRHSHRRCYPSSARRISFDFDPNGILYIDGTRVDTSLHKT